MPRRAACACGPEATADEERVTIGTGGRPAFRGTSTASGYPRFDQNRRGSVRRPTVVSQTVGANPWPTRMSGIPIAAADTAWI